MEKIFPSLKMERKKKQILQLCELLDIWEQADI